MRPIETKKELDKILNRTPSSNTLGLVPTMGALHKGHLALVKKAVQENDRVVVSIFVNPTQFNNKEDLVKYPKDLSKDLELIESVDPDIIVFAPSVEEIYAQSVRPKKYDFQGLDNVMEGEFRDDHFNGVGTIVEQLFSLIQPNNAYFGEKDFQQLRIIKKLVEIQKIPVNIIPCPIVREDHGLAMSSRNERLSENIRLKAGFIFKTLQTAKEKFGTKSALKVKEWVKNQFLKEEDFEMEYFEIADVETLSPLKRKVKNKKYRAFIAVYAEDIRLIDNIALN
ncbi:MULTISPECIES: pantoate--beta-alanine ligase [Maribacter]|uniref:Pantothenate synthetase n=2 Tax=Maribacter TaxID=252356 RepID=A0A5R8MAZ4_9FLAO|nr:MULTISPECIES: pantoate--beta-alanine ligase [Maribacter]MDC6404456.1 pantoate--beta-alanine ligase [Maribacter sp. PR66]MEE1971600.1 pantoate--beta-alanine ligase [Maribacter flavus]TLF46733.1 pantoate--beta-alanine ligase [Maribacter aurantiacus]